MVKTRKPFFILATALLGMTSGTSHAVLDEEAGKQLLYCAFIVGNSPAPNDDYQKRFTEYRNQLMKAAVSAIPKEHIEADISAAYARFEEAVRLRDEGKADRSLLQQQMDICDRYMSSGS